MGIQFSDCVENIVRKEEIARHTRSVDVLCLSNRKIEL